MTDEEIEELITGRWQQEGRRPSLCLPAAAEWSVALAVMCQAFVWVDQGRSVGSSQQALPPSAAEVKKAEWWKKVLGCDKDALLQRMDIELGSCGKEEIEQLANSIWAGGAAGLDPGVVTGALDELLGCLKARGF